MALLKFNVSDIRILMEHTKNAPEHVPLYNQGEKPPAGLWLVGDQGVYLMSNGQPNLLHDGTLRNENTKEFTSGFVVYAKGINPDIDEEWFDTKRATFGGDDGSDFIALDSLENIITPKKRVLTIDITPTTFRIY